MPNQQLISEEYKKRFQALTVELGHVPTTKDQEYWALSDWYRDQFDTDRVARQKEEAYEKARERAANSGPVKVVEKICRTCPNIIPPQTGRGRPPVFCSECRDKKKPKRVELQAEEVTL